MTRTGTTLATTSRGFKELPSEITTKAKEIHGCEYYDHPKHAGLQQLATTVAPLAVEALAVSDLYVHDAGPLLIAETGASYELQALVINEIIRLGMTGDIGCMVDCLAQMDPTLKRRVPRTTIYVTRAA